MDKGCSRKAPVGAFGRMVGKETPGSCRVSAAKSTGDPPGRQIGRLLLVTLRVNLNKLLESFCRPNPPGKEWWKWRQSNEDAATHRSCPGGNGTACHTLSEWAAVPPTNAGSGVLPVSRGSGGRAAGGDAWWWFVRARFSVQSKFTTCKPLSPGCALRGRAMPQPRRVQRPPREGEAGSPDHSVYRRACTPLVSAARG